jgi:hypothetical protein
MALWDLGKGAWRMWSSKMSERLLTLRGVERLAFIYCHGTDAEGASQIANTNTILRSFVKQLSDAGNAQKLMTAVINASHETHHKADLAEKQSFNLIVALVNESTSTTLVIDGLDECALKVQRTVRAKIKEFVGNRNRSGQSRFF